MATAARRASPAQVAVFAKAPVPGEVKTRLVPLLGAQDAAELHATLVRLALANARNAGIGPVSLWCMPDTGHPFFAACAAAFGATLHAQLGGHLGERMARAFDQLLGAGPALIVGADCPALKPEDLRAAAGSLATHDAVLQPAEDGGYVLVGLSRAVPGLFEGIRWGEAGVMRETRARLRVAGATWREMPVRWDVDRPEDYRRLLASGLLAEAPR
ncbi:MAG: TIGR04282 family arsenosugar biosynthesis glycosyltransferase [Burkholderiales bacterium]